MAERGGEGRRKDKTGEEPKKREEKRREEEISEEEYRKVKIVRAVWGEVDGSKGIKME